MRRLLGSPVAAFAALIATSAVPAAASAGIEPGARIERAVHSQAADASKVRESYVRVYEPLPASAGPHPRRCDWIGYLRFRSSGGPRRSAAADTVLVSMPGILAGASMHDQIARGVVRAGARRGADLEYWALDRRSNCLEDHRGVRAAARARDETLALDYYYGDRKVAGRRFGGFKSFGEARFLSEVGLEQTLRDWVAEALTHFPLREAPLNHEIALKSHEIQLPHRDPADHLLAATALVYELRLVTFDARLQGLGWLPTLSA